ncbi:MAG TPA: hypothetical protein VK116_04455, partial [Planctomycetota bacterium]|nr:hypothetical protein [Planctomycetota bacterium]
MRRLAEARARGRVLLRVTIVAPLLLACGCGLVERAALRRAMRRVGEDHSALGSEVAAGQTEGAIVAASSLLHALAAPEITEYGPYRFDPAYQRSLHDALET